MFCYSYYLPMDIARLQLTQLMTDTLRLVGLDTVQDLLSCDLPTLGIGTKDQQIINQKVLRLFELATSSMCYDTVYKSDTSRKLQPYSTTTTVCGHRAVPYGLFSNINHMGWVDCKTGFPQLDALLGGCIRAGELTEFFGLDKDTCDQICLSALTHLISTDDSSWVVIVENGNRFSPTNLWRLLCKILPEIGKKSTMDVMRLCMSRVRVQRVYDWAGLMTGMERIHSFCSQRVYSSDLYTDQTQCNNLNSWKLHRYPSAMAILGLSQLLGPVATSQHSHLIHISARRIRAIAKEFDMSILLSSHGVESNVTGRETHCVDTECVPALGKMWSDLPHSQVRNQTTKQVYMTMQEMDIHNPHVRITVHEESMQQPT
eukprot:GHVQ01002350.1.p1 GENE.GHVQ01002350.1~~GHVQ01002350.1.p1  ORF type:complete len:373 (+),score=42.83 GHVQ01002350.1:213-1331(+)